MLFESMVSSTTDYSLYMIPALWVVWMAPQVARAVLTSRFTQQYSSAQPRVENDPALLRGKVTQSQYNLLVRLKSAHENSLEFMVLAMPVLLMQHLPMAGTTIVSRNDFAASIVALRAAYVVIYATQFAAGLAKLRSVAWMGGIFILVRTAIRVAGDISRKA
ncbi:hypothetical protein CXG81DRAFT_26260 [Caulochytrium protostelioides]|uniref:MAPEG-domain-containing protein n=1 Tax=Caulochytrium protostelioides TaxID=1555241 RepID=A0A4P9X772_9FUNG|nr:hypothetical protein CXG81DRAFT_26260 [Caulochytrium protostelioides]|eukprot:RKP01065.1 hypothetical protein CXG81DRAFT_26260 [Caulochytrium protostelioides]